MSGIQVSFAIVSAIIPFFSHAVVARAPTADAAVAWAHLMFNVTVAMVFLVSLRWVEPWVARRLGVDSSPSPVVGA